MQADCWIVTDGARGNEKQCLALAHYLKAAGALRAPEPRRFRIALRQPWDALAPRLTLAAAHGLQPAADSNPNRWQEDRQALLTGPLPRLLLSCGRRGALLARMLKNRSSGHQLSTVQVLNPRISPAGFDWVVCPRHDQLSGHNVLQTEGALHKVDDQYLAAARQQWSQLEPLASPRTAVLIGASNGAYRIDQRYLDELLSGAAALTAGGSLLVTTSRRTPPALETFVRRWLKQHLPQRHVFFADHPGQPNPYPGLLAYANRIVVSSDSVNMISEALGTGRPVHSLHVGTSNRRFSRFQQLLISSGRLLSLADSSQPTYQPLRETAAVADIIAAALAGSPT